MFIASAPGASTKHVSKTPIKFNNIVPIEASVSRCCKPGSPIEKGLQTFDLLHLFEFKTTF